MFTSLELILLAPTLADALDVSVLRGGEPTVASEIIGDVEAVSDYISDFEGHKCVYWTHCRLMRLSSVRF